MPKFLIPHKKKIMIIGGLIVAVCFIAVLTIIVETRRGVPSNNPVSTSTTASSAQQSVDTGLSLIPSSTPSVPPQQPTPPITYSGCKLGLNFSITGGSIQATGTMNYILTAKNMGNTACRSASISLYYADGESYVSASPAATDGYYWQLGDLGPGSEKDIALTTDRVAPLADGNITDEACLSANNGADACNNSISNTSSTVGSTPATAPNIPSTSILPMNSFSPSSTKEAGVWVWTSLSDMTTAQMQKVIDEASANNFNAIYITVDEYISISVLPDGIQKQQQLADFNDDITEFLSLAAQKNIAVDAEAGARDWVESENTWKAGKIMAFIASYNQTHAQKFRGVQYDIEPYLLPQYDNDKGTVLAEYVQLIDQLVQQDKSNDLPLGIVVPHFYDSNEGWTPKVAVDGIADYTYGHILRLLNELPAGNGSILIMAYRNFATGSDSAIALSQQEIKEADATNVKVLVAQETGPVTPSYVTFSGTSRATLFAQIGAIDAAYASNPSFAGIAIDYLDPYLELR